MSRKRKIGNPATNNFVVDTLHKNLERIREFFVPGTLCRNKTICTVWKDTTVWCDISHKWSLFDRLEGEAYKVLEPETVLMVVGIPTLTLNKKYASLSIYTCEILVDDHVWTIVLPGSINAGALGNMFSKIETKSVISTNNEEKRTCL